ncbi:aminoglycoside phosphotransferase family protein [Fictibacillus halophilus]|uniref:aminoglycoside phosphotransferase family protein n=1 Tax=Fictibacillus halophilus TaxID=1610490 RepID=UPI001CFA9D9B|nr:phosphotransferase [Fictibacillus halophilus]
MGLEQTIGEGSTAKVIVMDDRTVAKQFFDRVSHSSIDNEYLKSKAVMHSGLPVPAVLKKMIHNGQTALLYERINGSPLTQKLSKQPWTAIHLINQMANLQVLMHDKEIFGLPQQVDIMQQKITLVNELSEAEKCFIAEHLSKLSTGKSLCHGDFHPDNILLCDRGPVIIDWADASEGNRLADLARTLVILNYGGMHSGMKPFKLNAVLYVRNLLAHKYLRSYRRSFHFSLDSLKEWMLPVTAARLSENLPDQEKERLVMLVKQHLENVALK